MQLLKNLGLKLCQKIGRCSQEENLIDAVKKILDEDKRENPFVDNKPGRAWLTLFFKRHPDISLRTPETVTKNRTAVSEEYFKAWFSEVYDYLSENGLTWLLEDPGRLFNTDETGCKLCPKSNTVIAEKGSKNVAEVLPSSENRPTHCLVLLCCRWYVTTALGCIPLPTYP